MKRRAYGNVEVVSEHYHSTPEHRLWAAVVARALGDLNPGHSVAAEAYAWIMSDDERPMSFIFACHVIDLDPIAVRDKVKSLKGEELAVTSKQVTDSRKGNTLSR